jgi:hypothetical protein
MDNWKKDSTDEELIPQHDILYIKHVDGDIVWDRGRRIDKIFRSEKFGLRRVETFMTNTFTLFQTSSLTTLSMWMNLDVIKG